MTKVIERLGGSVTTSPEDFTVFVTLEPAKGQKERGFVKSLNTLSALASGKSYLAAKVMGKRLRPTSQSSSSEDSNVVTVPCCLVCLASL